MGRTDISAKVYQPVISDIVTEKKITCLENETQQPTL